MSNDLELYYPSKTMTIKELSEALNCSRDLIEKIIRKEMPNLMSKGKTTLLDEIQVTAIKLLIQSDNNFRQVSEVKTDLEKELLIQQAMTFQAEKIQSMKLQIEDMKPKADFYDQVTGSKDAIDISSVAKVLNKGIGRNKLFELLREKKILQHNNQPYQTYIDRGYFRTIEQSYTHPNGTTHINIKTVVYQKGLDFIRKILDK